MFDIVLQEMVSDLSDVVVVGYGTQKKSDLTGSISSIKGAELKSSSAASFDAALTGKAAGVQVTTTSGEPGAGVSINIRGKGTVMGSNEPLYVIDGFPIYTNENVASPGTAGEFRGYFTNPLSTINPGDIESIEILKDASATSIYGSRGANGVVLITTKKGKKVARK
ncbi:MAG: TonB-dependent receptor plug domain-containing protein [Agriterribacter sp.]